MAERGDESLVHTLKKVAAVLKQSEIPFALGGSFAVYAHGGHSSEHDVDFLIREVDVEKALEAWSPPGSSPSALRRTGWSRSSTTAGWWI